MQGGEGGALLQGHLAEVAQREELQAKAPILTRVSWQVVVATSVPPHTHTEMYPAWNPVAPLCNRHNSWM